MKRRALIAVGLLLTALVTTLWAYDARLDKVRLWKFFQMEAGSQFINRDGNDIADQLDVLDTIDSTDLTKIDGITNGTAAANKAVVLGASKEIATITTATITTGNVTTLNATNVDAGASGTAGTVDVFPTTASKGKIAITAADSAGDTTTTIVNASQAGARTYTIPDAGASASFVMSAGAATIGGAKTFSSALITAANVGAKNGASVAAVEYGEGTIHQTVLTCTATPFTFGDEAGQGQYGGTKIYDFPEGLILFMGGVVDGAMTLTAPAIDTWDGDIGLGVEAPTDHQDAANKNGYLLASTATTTAVAKVATVDAVSTCTVITESAARWLDGTATAKDVFLNLLVDDNGAHDNTITGTFTGTVTITWMNLGDK